MAANNIGNLEGKVVIDVSQALTDIGNLASSLERLAAKIEQMSKAQTIGPSIRNLAALEKAAKAMDTLRSAGQPAPAATAAAGGGSVSAEGSLKLTNEEEIGAAIAKAIKSKLESQTFDLKVNLKIANMEDLPGQLKGLSGGGTSGSGEKPSGSGIPGVSPTQKWNLDKAQFRATNELTSAVRKVLTSSSGATGSGATVKEGMKSFADLVNSGALDAEMGGKIRVEGSSLSDQIADAVAKFLDLAPNVTRAGKGVGSVPLGEVSSFADITDDFDEVLDDFRRSVLVPILFTAKQSKFDVDRIYSAPAAEGPAPTAERPPVAEPTSTRNAFDARLEAASAAAVARRTAVGPAPSARAAATGELQSDPTRIVSRASAEEEQRKLDEMIAAGIENKPESYKTREQAFERIRGLMEYGGQIGPLNVIGALSGIPHVGAVANARELRDYDDRKRGLLAALRDARNDVEVRDPDTKKPITAANKLQAMGSLQKRIDALGDRPPEVRMDEAAVASELTRMGAGKGFRDAPKAIPALEPLLKLINKGELQDIGQHKETGTYFFPSNDAERFQLRRVGYGDTVTMGERGLVQRMKPGDFLREYLTQQIKDQVHREGEYSEDPLVRRMAGMGDDERELEAKALVDRLMVGVGGRSSIASEWLASAAERSFAGQGTKFDQQSMGNRGDYEARQNLELKRVQDEIEGINRSGRIGPKRRARLDELTALQEQLVGQGAETSMFSPALGRNEIASQHFYIPLDDVEKPNDTRQERVDEIKAQIRGGVAQVPIDVFENMIGNTGRVARRVSDGAHRIEAMRQLRAEAAQELGVPESETPYNRILADVKPPEGKEYPAGKVVGTSTIAYDTETGRVRELASEQFREPIAYTRSQTPGPDREPDFVQRIQSEANAASRAGVESGFGLEAGGLWERLDAQQKKVEEALSAEIMDKIRDGELLNPNDFAVDALHELEPLSGTEKRDRANTLADELTAGLKEYAKATFGKDEERKRIYMREVKSRMTGLRRSAALPRPGGAAQKPGGYSAVRPRGMNERTDPFLETDLDNADRRTGRGYTERDLKRPLETTIERDKDVLRSKILDEFSDIGDRIDLDIAGIKEDSDQARRRGQATRGQTGASRADFRRSRLGKEVETPGDVPRYVELTPEEEEAKFGARYKELAAAVNQYRKLEMAQRAARGVIRRSGLDASATLEQRNTFLQGIAADEKIPKIVKQEVGDLLSERNFGHVGEAIVKSSAMDRENYVPGDKLREIYAKGAPLSNGEMVGGGGETAGGGGFAGPGVYQVFVTNWPAVFAKAAGGGNGRGGGRGRLLTGPEEPDEPRRGRGREYGPFLRELREPRTYGPSRDELQELSPTAWPRIQMLRDPRTAQVPPQMRIAMRPRVAHTEEERAARPVTGRQYGPTLRDLAPPAAADPSRPLGNAATLAGVGTRIRMMPQERQSAAGRALQQYYDRQEKAQSSKGQIDERIKRLTAPLPNMVVDARVASQNAAQRLQSRSIGTSIVSAFESLNPNRQRAQAARVRLNERTSTLDTLVVDKDGAIGSQARSAVNLREANRKRRNLIRSGVEPGLIPTDLAAERKTAGEEYVAAKYAVKEFGKAITQVQGEIDVLSKEAGGLGTVFSTLATGAVGGVVGAAVTMGVSAIAEGGIKALAMAIGPTLERMTGNTATTARVQQGLGQTVAQSGGYTSASVSAQLAQTGISEQAGKKIMPVLSARADSVAASQQVMAQLDMIRTEARAAVENLPYNGFDKGLFSTTGGIQGTPINGVPSVSEQLYDIMKPLTMDNAFKTWMGEDAVKAAKNALVDFESQVNRSEKGLRLHVDATQKDTKANKQLAANAEKFKNPGWAQLIRETGMTVTGNQTADPFAELMKQLATNATRPTASFAAAAMEPQLKAQRYSELAQNRLQIDTVIPQQFAMQQAFNPLIGSNFSADSVLRAMTKGTGATLDKGKLSRLFGSVSNVQTSAATGREALLDFGKKNLPVAESNELARNLAEAAAKGNEIANLRMDSQIKQAALSASQYAESLRQAKIAAADARAMAGLKPSARFNEPTSAGNLGAYQRSDFMLGQQSARLGQAMTQRQINFKRAMAGFTAPGITPEQRAANIEYAKVETDYEQKQLNISKKLTANQAAEFNITSARNVTLTANQVSLMAQGQQTAADVALDESMIAALTAELQQPMQKVEQTYNTALQTQLDKISGIATVIAQTGESFTAVKDAMKDMIPAINDWANSLGIDTGKRDDTRPRGIMPQTHTPYVPAGGAGNVSINFGGVTITSEGLENFVKQLGSMVARHGLRML